MPVLWFCNSPNDCIADNRRVLEQRSDAHQKFIQSGGQKTRQVNSDDAYIKRVGAFSNLTSGKISKNVMTFHNVCPQGRKVGSFAKVQDAKMPLTFASFLVKFLSREGDLVVDPIGGTLTTGQAAPQNNRRWLCVEMMHEYIAQCFVRFDNDDLFINPAFINHQFH